MSRGSVVTEGTIKVVCGANSREVALERDFSVKDLREIFSNDLGILKDARTFVSGNQVPSNYVLRPGEQLEFVKPSGQKG